MRLVLTGGRQYSDTETVFRVLDALRPTRVAQGGGTGLDELARLWCEARGVECRTYPANWEEEGRAAGPRRNGRMLIEERPDALLAFPGNAGTRDCVRQARAMGLIVLEVRA